MENFNQILAVFMAMMFTIMQYHGTVAQTRHIVGDSLGWSVPSSGAVAYTNWASRQTFNVDDLLVFNFTDGEHDVAEVSEAAYDPCTATNPLSFATNGPATITLTTVGPHYFICTFRSHCQIGQKLTINVSAVESNTSPPSATPTAPVSPPTTTLFPPSTSPPTTTRTPSSATLTKPSAPGPPTSFPISCPASPSDTTSSDSTPPPSDGAPSFTAVTPATFLIMGLVFLNY